MKYKVGDKIVAWLVQSDPNAVLSGLIGLLGSVIGAAASLLAVFMSNNLQKHGKISLHARIVGSRVDKQHRTWGYRQTDQGLSFHIPLWLDICNTSNISRIVRNVNLCIVKNRTIVHEFTQFQGNGIEPQEPNTVIIGNEGHGISTNISEACSGSVYIPISSNAESLNASVAASVIMWEQNNKE